MVRISEFTYWGLKSFATPSSYLQGRRNFYTSNYNLLFLFIPMNETSVCMSIDLCVPNCLSDYDIT